MGLHATQIHSHPRPPLTHRKAVLDQHSVWGTLDVFSASFSGFLNLLKKARHATPAPAACRRAGRRRRPGEPDAAAGAAALRGAGRSPAQGRAALGPAATPRAGAGGITSAPGGRGPCARGGRGRWRPRGGWRWRGQSRRARNEGAERESAAQVRYPDRLADKQE